jgi:hypothetical protein
MAKGAESGICSELEFQPSVAIINTLSNFQSGFGAENFTACPDPYVMEGARVRFIADILAPLSCINIVKFPACCCVCVSDAFAGCSSASPLKQRITLHSKANTNIILLK